KQCGEWTGPHWPLPCNPRGWMVGAEGMRQRWRQVIFAGVVFSFAVSAGLAADHCIRAGFATADLTPPLGLEMGGFGMNLERKGEAVHDSLLARAVVLELDHRKVASVGCDLVGIRAAI